MRSYLDPHTFLFSKEEWENYKFEGRLSDLIDMLSEASQFEKRAKTSSKLLKFKSNSDEASAIYSYNPFNNDPPLPSYYVKQFRNEILPELIRRFTFCPEEKCFLPSNQRRSRPAARDETDELTQDFIAGLDLCRTCGDNSPACLITHADHPSLIPDSGFFDQEIDASANGVLHAMSADSLFPTPDAWHLREVHMWHALEVEKAHKELDDKAWEQYPLRPLRYSPSFWTALRQADWAGHEQRYKRQIVETLLQISTGRSTSSRLHRMATQQVVVDSERHAKWNAYVFQSGASDQDRRCSRIYYATVGDAVFVESYEPDAHHGE